MVKQRTSPAPSSSSKNHLAENWTNSYRRDNQILDNKLEGGRCENYSAEQTSSYVHLGCQLSNPRTRTLSALHTGNQSMVRMEIEGESNSIHGQNQPKEIIYRKCFGNGNNRANTNCDNKGIHKHQSVSRHTTNYSTQEKSGHKRRRGQQRRRKLLRGANRKRQRYGNQTTVSATGVNKALECTNENSESKMGRTKPVKRLGRECNNSGSRNKELSSIVHSLNILSHSIHIIF